MNALDTGYYIPASLVVVAAFLQQRQHPKHKPIFILFSFGLAGNLARRLIKLFVLDHERAAMVAAGLDPINVPFTGHVRAIFHVHQALTIGWGFAVLAAMAAVLLGRRPRLVLLAFVASLALLIAGYPELRYERLAATLYSIHEVRLLIGVMILGRWLRQAAERRYTIEAFALVLAFLAHAFTGIALFRMSFPKPGEMPWLISQAESIGLQFALLLLYVAGPSSIDISSKPSRPSSSQRASSNSAAGAGARRVLPEEA